MIGTDLGAAELYAVDIPQACEVGGEVNNPKETNKTTHKLKNTPL